MNGDLIVVLLVVGLPILAALPTIVGLIRGVDDKPTLILLNVIGVCTGAVWFAALVVAFMMPKRSRRVVTPPAAPVVWPPYEVTCDDPDREAHWPVAS